MSTASSLYQQYCSEKGYAKAPATVRATTTSDTGAATVTAGGGSADPTSSFSDTNQTPASSSKKPLSITVIVGIAVGSFAGLVIMIVMIKKLFGAGGWFRTNPNKHIQQQHAFALQQPHYGQQPIFPPQHIQEPYIRKPPSDIGVTDAEVEPSDSISDFSAPWAAPTLMSAAPARTSPYNPAMPPYNQEPPPYQGWGR
jgi:hypothetical protein